MEAMATPVALHNVIAGAAHDGPIWSHTSEQLNVNLIYLSAGAGIEAHTNREVDVLIVVVEGAGRITVDTLEHELGAGDTLVIARGAQRAITSLSSVFAYISCHRRRAGLMPS